MKKLLFLCKSLTVIFSLLLSVYIYAAEDNIPKTINIQGKLTTDSGQPITETKTLTFIIYDGSGSSVLNTSTSVTPDSEGLYSTDIDVSSVFSNGYNFNGKYSFKVDVGGVSSGQTYFASSPNAFYASTSTYTLSLDPNGEKLKNENFSTDTYEITVKAADKITTTGDTDGLVWATVKDDNNNLIQDWLSPSSIQIGPAKTDKLGGIRLGSDTGLLMKSGTNNEVLKVNNGAGLLINDNNQLILDTDISNLTKYTKTSDLADVATSGSYTSLSDKPTIGDATLTIQKNGTNAGTFTANATTASTINITVPTNTGDLTNNSGFITKDVNNLSNYTKTSDLADVATSGSYTSLSDKPTIGDATLTIQKNGTNAGTFTANATTASTINITVPTNTGDLTNNSGFITKDVNNLSNYTKTSDLADVATSGSYTSLSGKPTKLSDFTDDLGSSPTHTHSQYLTAHQSIKTLKTNNTSAQTESANESITGSGTINLHKVSKTGSYSDLLDKPTIPTVVDTYSSTGTDAISGKGVKAALDSFVVGGFTAGVGLEKEGSVVNVTTAPAAQQITNTNTINASSGDIYVWAASNSNKTNQGWYKVALNSRGTLSSYVNLERGADLAEIYQSTEKLVPGDVVSIDTTKDNAIVKTKVAEDTLVAGVISTEPAVLMNQNEKGYKLALVGKVPTKVCNEGGAIKRGDLLVSASIPGYAKKAGDNPKIGTVIGKALENSDSQKGTILVLVNLQ